MMRTMELEITLTEHRLQRQDLIDAGMDLFARVLQIRLQVIRPLIADLELVAQLERCLVCVDA